MRKITVPLLLLCGLSVLLPLAEAADPPKGFTSIFNGKDLTGWRGMGHFNPQKLAKMSEEARANKHAADLADAKKHWSVDDGELVNDGHGVYLTTDKSYGDIEFLIDYKTVAKADSGIYLRASPQVQIWDYTKEGGKWGIGADKGSGGLWNNSKGAAGKDPSVLADKPFGQWNSFRILQVGDRTSVWLNGKQVVDMAPMENYWNRKLPLRRNGPIQLQTHGGEIRWRNIAIREIGAEEANKLLSKAGEDEFTSIFNGKALSGWAGPIGAYQIKDGALTCPKRGGGTIYTKKVYADFVVRFEFNMPPGGNNGLAIRYPGGGATAYVGMCELQVLDNSAKGYAKRDPRQYHGSAYGMAAAHRGYQRPVGEWNYQQVTVQGSKIRVELNGTTILDADLSKITKFMGRKVKGKDRKEGHFGFAGHGSPVQYRNVRIKTLK